MVDCVSILQTCSLHVDIWFPFFAQTFSFVNWWEVSYLLQKSNTEVTLFWETFGGKFCWNDMIFCVFAPNEMVLRYWINIQWLLCLLLHCPLPQVTEISTLRPVTEFYVSLSQLVSSTYHLTALFKVIYSRLLVTFTSCRKYLLRSSVSILFSSWDRVVASHAT